MKKSILLSLALLPIVCSCDNRTTLQKKIDEVNEQCNFRINYKLEDFGRLWDSKYSGQIETDHFKFKERREDGIDVYTLGTVDYLTTEFYFRLGFLKGFKTRDPDFGFSIYGYTIRYPSYNLDEKLLSKGFEFVSSDRHREADVLPNGVRYVWNEFYFEKLHINYSYNLLYSIAANITEIEVFLYE